MNFKSLLSQLDQLNEAETKTIKTGRIHKGDYGTEHQPDIERDEYGHRIPKSKKDDKKDDKPAVKKGRGRPTKATQASGEDKKYDFSALGVKSGKDVKLPKYDKKKTKKHSIKEYLDQLYAPLNETGITVKPMPGASQIIGANGKPMGTADAATANMIKAADQKGTLNLGGEETMEDSSDAASDKREALAKQIYDLAMSIHTDDRMYGHYDPQENAQLDKLKAEFARLYPGENPVKIGSELSTNEFHQKQQQRNAEFKQNQQAATRSTGIMQKAKNALGGMFEADEQIDEGSTGDYSAKKARAGKDIGKPGKNFSKIAKSSGGGEKGDKIAGAVLKNQRAKTNEADQPPRDALASPLTLEAKKPDANKNGIPDYAEDGKGKNDLKKKKVKEGMEHKLKAAYHAGKAHGLTGGSHCGKNYEDMEEARQYHEGYKCGLDECYGQMPIQGYVGEESGADVVGTMASYGAEEGQLGEADIEESPFSWAAKNTSKGDKFQVGGKEFVKNDAFAFEALEKQLNALLEDKEVTEGMTVSISKGQQGSPDSVSVSAQDGEADQLLSAIKQAGLGLFGGDEMMGQASPEPMTVDNGGEPAEVGAGGDAIEVVGDHDGMMSLMKKLSGIGGSEQPAHGDEHSHDEESEETCESCGGTMEEGHSCGEGQEMVDEVESEDQMTYQMAEDNPPDSGADNTDAEIADTAQANSAAAEYDASQDQVDESETDNGELTKEPTADEEQKDGLDLEESTSFFNLYKKLSMLSEESTSEKDDKAEKAAKKVAKDIEYDEGHKGKDDDKAEEAGKKVKKDIEYDDKKDKKDKVDESYANSADDAFEADIDFMVNVISGGLNKRKSTGQTTIPVVASQVNRTVSQGTKDINESSDSVSAWRKLAGIK